MPDINHPVNPNFGTSTFWLLASDISDENKFDFRNGIFVVAEVNSTSITNIYWERSGNSYTGISCGKSLNHIYYVTMRGGICVNCIDRKVTVTGTTNLIYKPSIQNIVDYIIGLKGTVKSPLYIVTASLETKTSLKQIKNYTQKDYTYTNGFWVPKQGVNYNLNAPYNDADLISFPALDSICNGHISNC